ncbi:MAG: hypothetical protein ABGZ53_35530, partial [Fuerstiella sp.]
MNESENPNSGLSRRNLLKSGAVGLAFKAGAQIPTRRFALVALAALALALLSFPFAVQAQTDRPNVLRPTAQAKSKPKASSATKSQLDQTSRLPNVLILFADDLGHGDVSYNGGDIPTPNIDALVADGVRFTSG